MTIDILTYQLKYKHDPMVLELLSVFEDGEAALEIFEYTKEDMKEAEQEGRDHVLKEVSDYADDLDDALDALEEGDEDEKKKAIKQLNNLLERMRF